MKFCYRFIVIIFFSFYFIGPIAADENVAFIDVDYIIKNSNVGKKILLNINDLNKKNINKLDKMKQDLITLETSINSKRNILSKNDFNEKLKILKRKAKEFTNEKNQIVKEFNNFQKDKLKKIFKLINPIINNYMKQNSIKILIDTKYVFMGNSESNITENILEIINNEIK